MWALPEDDFASRDGVVTSMEVRALALAKLGPAAGTVVWDVAAGSGAVAVECARLGATVVAVEADPVQCVRLIANASAHSADVQVEEADVLSVIDKLPAPDAVFVGGGALDVVQACAATGAARIVVALTAIDRIIPARDALRDAGYLVEGCQLSAARLVDDVFVAVAPATLLWGLKK